MSVYCGEKEKNVSWSLKNVSMENSGHSSRSSIKPRVLKQFLPAGALALAVMLLAGCGGSGSDAPTTTAPPIVERPTDPRPTVERLPYPYQPTGTYSRDGLPPLADADAARTPVYWDGERLMVGVDQGSQYVDTFTISDVGSPGFTIGRIIRDLAAALPVATERGDTEVRYGRLSDGVGEQVVAAYLDEARGSFATALRWEGVPEVRLVGAPRARDRQLLVAAVQLVNAALPAGSKLSVGTSTATRSDAIDVEFVDCYGARHTCGGGSAAATTFTRIRNGERVADAHVYFCRETNSYGREHEAVTLLAHELLHALGFDEHVSSQFASINVGTGALHHARQHGVNKPMSLLYPVDRKALRALYGRLDVGDDPTAFGPWGATTLRVEGVGPHATFGVALRNGYAEPWAYGRAPAGTLSANPALSGEVVWTGALLGLTPAGAAVADEAHIGVDLGTLIGAASFAGLESWTGAPGEPGTGATWGDGDLGYSLVIRGNTLRETGGDAGVLTGVFVGAAHEGAAGTLERDDLTAAFGVER